MTGSIQSIWRHPIKAHGRERLDRVTLAEGQTMPWDRRWAVAHELAEADDTAWSPCQNFSRGSKVAALMAIDTRSDEQAGTVTLSHPDLPDLTVDPDDNAQALLDWVRALMPHNRAQSAKVVRVEGRGMTDTDYPTISLINLASGAELSDRMGQELSPLRWRANLHMEGLAPWEEMSWVGKSLRIGGVELEVREPIERCLATTANPNTGLRDADTLSALNSGYGHQNFGIYAVVTKGGEISSGDTVTVV